MADEIQEPTKPGAAAGLQVGKDMLVVLAGISTIWTCFSRGGLTAVYDWVNSIPAAPFLSLAGLGAIGLWNTVKVYRRQDVATTQHETIQTITGATTNTELKAIVEEAKAAQQ